MTNQEQHILTSIIQNCSILYKSMFTYADNVQNITIEDNVATVTTEHDGVFTITINKN